MGCWKQCVPQKPLKKTEIKNNRQKIKQVSNSQKTRNERYAEERKIYLENNPLCKARLLGCTFVATQIHHMEGRDGENLFKHFLEVCENCHHEIEMNPEMAKEREFSRTRLKTEND